MSLHSRWSQHVARHVPGRQERVHLQDCLLRRANLEIVGWREYGDVLLVSRASGAKLTVVVSQAAPLRRCLPRG